MNERLDAFSTPRGDSHKFTIWPGMTWRRSGWPTPTTFPASRMRASNPWTGAIGAFNGGWRYTVIATLVNGEIDRQRGLIAMIDTIGLIGERDPDCRKQAYAGYRRVDGDQAILV